MQRIIHLESKDLNCSLEKWLSGGLMQRKDRMSLEHLTVPKRQYSKKLKDEHVKQRSQPKRAPNGQS